MTITGRCHCQRNQFAVDGEIPEKLTRCTCTMCRTHGNLYAYYRPDQLAITEATSDATYRWQSKMVAHHFCSACGCYIYADSPAFEPDGKWDGKTRRVGVNARLFDDFEAADHPVMVIDGLNQW